jgi:pimeloyl-ACP methyl ester carboxylesterase
VLLLHGLGATNASMLPLLWDLAQTHRVIAPDLPGFGETAKPRARYDAAFFARWGVSFLDALAIPQATVIGNSLGGRVALEMGLHSADRVNGLVLLCPSAAFLRMRQFSPLVRLLRPELAALGMPLSHGLVVEGVRALFSVPDRLPASWYDAAADEFKRIFTSRHARFAFVSTLRQIYLERAHGELGFWDRLPGLTPPALFIWGDRDRLVPVSFARHVQVALPHSQSVVLDDCGHVPQFEHRDRTSDLVRAMLQGLG